MTQTAHILSLAEELRLPEAIGGPLAGAAESLPWNRLPVEALARPEEAEAAWRQALALLPAWEADDGMAQLAVMLAAACHTRALYREMGLGEAVFPATMGCFGRFLEETHRRTGRWAFDRGFWTWRQTGGLLFRLGELEYERRAAGAPPLPAGIGPADQVLSVHIPSDAVLSRAGLDQSYKEMRQFFCPERFPSGGRPKAALCGTWLLAPALEELLPEDSGIRRFAADYQRYAVDETDQSFYQWLFGGFAPVEALPEHTRLQRAVKAHLASGGRLGMARGVLRAGIEC